MVEYPSIGCKAMIRNPKGTTLAEMVVAIGLLGALLLIIALLAVTTTRSGKLQRRTYEANVVANNLLDQKQSTPGADPQIGPLAPVTGSFADGTPYSAALEIYAVSGSGPTSGLGNQEIRQLKATVTWKESTGAGRVSAQTYLARIAR